MADDHPALEPDIETDEGLEAFVSGIQRPIPERLRYPEAVEAHARMVAEAEAETEEGGDFTLEDVRNGLAELKARFSAGTATKVG